MYKYSRFIFLLRHRLWFLTGASFLWFHLVVTSRQIGVIKKYVRIDMSKCSCSLHILLKSVFVSVTAVFVMAKVNISNWTAEITSLDVNRETDALISNNALLVFNYVMLAVVCQIIAVFGVGGNIINVFCFVKHGFKESVNVSLLGIYISCFCLFICSFSLDVIS